MRNNENESEKPAKKPRTKRGAYKPAKEKKECRLNLRLKEADRDWLLNKGAVSWIEEQIAREKVADLAKSTQLSELSTESMCTGLTPIFTLFLFGYLSNIRMAFQGFKMQYPDLDYYSLYSLRHEYVNRIIVKSAYKDRRYKEDGEGKRRAINCRINSQLHKWIEEQKTARQDTGKSLGEIIDFAIRALQLVLNCKS